ncbi:hypothetical protein CDL15_Pgr005193 [Punica granatum]|uniref:Uncharacterized protein n=1 Tax=Punica granatum TaxID=22663 RepID=A0A218WPS9_PUNGR|nr:hypothetical protein CDL15_Pgr005193 [Punica granatum]
MDTEKTSPTALNKPQITSCRKKKDDDATFLEDLKDHMDEFINASMDEHESCFKKTVQKVPSPCSYFKLIILSHLTVFLLLIRDLYLQMFGMSKVVAERSTAAEEVEISLPLRTVVSK